ncbi:hypothetical protein [Litoreibacter arenae]|uniref:Uncharacterized protein n=1 Tax=Litoreibacter arenae DSM 19593 TaxID=1123360 RepID=S9RU59_9RHOB|nr:hypothetical protein [Litoreibacter arenae]EPX81565.1 hypothetical protein thalar_00120 [Litoreibacter arenae DSM 19593]
MMKNDWIIDVLMDLKKFSARNNFSYLAEHLDDTIMVASTELASSSNSMRHMAGDGEQTGRHARGAFTGDNA